MSPSTSGRVLSVIAGALRGAERRKKHRAHTEDALAKRWRLLPDVEAPEQQSDVIPLLDGWIRRLERQAGDDPAVRSR
jgi:hypothetical protein